MKGTVPSSAGEGVCPICIELTRQPCPAHHDGRRYASGIPNLTGRSVPVTREYQATFIPKADDD
jgi:hypothetical protein